MCWFDSMSACALAASAAGKTWWITGLTAPDSSQGHAVLRSASAIFALKATGRGRSVEPVIHQVFAAARAAEAHTLMESNQHIGKLVLTW